MRLQCRSCQNSVYSVASTPGLRYGRSSPQSPSRLLPRSLSTGTFRSGRPRSAMDFSVSQQLGGIRTGPTQNYSPNPYGLQFNSLARSSPSHGFSKMTEKRFPEKAKWGQHSDTPVMLKPSSSDNFYNVPSSIGAQALSTKRSMTSHTPGKRSSKRQDHLYGGVLYYGKETEQVRRRRQTSSKDVVDAVGYGRPPSSIGGQIDSTKRSSPSAGFGSSTDSRFGYFERSIRANVSPPPTRYIVHS
mmetsp:Transcript_33677/g.86344  ORF Transcript_33677/g.86344 Transcript_33677/m.86344 type:complete len:244 (-) Transcript_33677:335-1066(-)